MDDANNSGRKDRRRPPRDRGDLGAPEDFESSVDGRMGEPLTGRVVHDDRGNAIWDWIKETGRIAIGSTSRMLKKLEAPELEVVDDKDPKRRTSGRDPGGGYDPYNQTNRPCPKAPRKR
jgi:hypothetical protein